MSPEDKILAALTFRAMSRHELSKIIGMDDLRTMGILRRMREADDIRLTGDGRYERMPICSTGPGVA